MGILTTEVILSKPTALWLGLVTLLHAYPIAASDGSTMTKEQLGQMLFFDVNLSQNRTQSCATCHNPNHAFIDNRASELKGMVSKGDDGVSFGDRNTPTASYANKIPRITRNDAGEFKGGLFHDGRERDLAGQAGGPL